MTKQNFPRIIILLLLCGITYLALSFLPSKNTRTIHNIQYVVGKIHLLNNEDRQTLNVDIATTPAAHDQGLMHQKEWGKVEIIPFIFDLELKGMLFIFDKEIVRNFWMKNTHLPLDIIFFDARGQLVHIARHATPFSQELIPSLLPAQYVLELPAGDAAARNLTGDSRLDLQSLQKLLP